VRAPPSLLSLLEDGLIEAVLRPLQSGKEAQIYLVMAGGEHRVAKVYKAAHDRNFKHRTDYVEGRGTRNTRDQRAMKRRSSYGKGRDEDSWRSTEVEMIHRLRHAEVRVPAPHLFSDGVLIMELVQGADGAPAPRIGDLHLSPEEAVSIHDALMRDVVRMLCAGIVHGDLSEFNVLLDANGPVIIDLPQAVDASSNPNARKLLLRDVENIQRFITRWVPGRKRKPFAAEMWALYEVNELQPDTELTGIYEGAEGEVDTAGVLDMIDDAEEDETQRRLGRGQKALSRRSDQPRVVINKQKRPSKKRTRAAAPKAEPPKPTRSKKTSLNDLVAAAANSARQDSPSSGRSRRRSGSPERQPAKPTSPQQGERTRNRGTGGSDDTTRRPRRRRDETNSDRRESTRSERSSRRTSSPEQETRRPARSQGAERPAAQEAEGTRRRRRQRSDQDDKPAGQESRSAGRSSRRPGESDRGAPRPARSDSPERPRSSEADGSPKRRRRRRSDEGRDPRKSERSTGQSSDSAQSGTRPARSKSSGGGSSRDADGAPKRRRRRRRRPEGDGGAKPPRD